MAHFLNAISKKKRFLNMLPCIKHVANYAKYHTVTRDAITIKTAMTYTVE